MKPSEYRPHPSGLYLPLKAKVRGRLRWSVLDERGVPEVPRNPGGFALGPAEGVEQHNLITDLGLDHLPTYDALLLSTGASNGWRRYMAVGTGSTAPANADTELDAEVQRAASSGSFGDGANTYELDDTEDVWRCTSLVRRVVTMTADRNLTEFGLSPSASLDIGVRELLRDGSNNPITVSLLTGKSLRVDHSLIVELPAPEAGIPVTVNIEEYDAANNLENTISQDLIHGGHIRGSTFDATKAVNMFHVWNPKSNVTGIIAYSGAWPYQRIEGTFFGSQISVTGVLQPYTPGTHQLIKRWVVPEGRFNFAWTAVRVQPAQNASQDGGWVIVFSAPASYTKVNTDTLRIGLVSSWARA